MSDHGRTASARREELLDRAYRYALGHGLAGMSLRPLASAIGSSPRVLLFLFGSKDGLIRALLDRARAEELALLDRGRRSAAAGGPDSVIRTTWGWLVAEPHRPLLTLWVQAYARSLTEPDGPWAGFAQQTVDDWLAVLAGDQPADRAADRGEGSGPMRRTLALAVLRGALLDLLATGDAERITAAVDLYLDSVAHPAS